MKRTYLIIIYIIIILIILGIILTRDHIISKNPQNQSFTESVADSSPIVSNNSDNNQELDNIIQVLTPHPNDVISSPLTITGKTRGSWYFEASFPVTLKDSQGTILAQAPAQAQGEWMTNDFVPFSVTLTFPQPTTNSGTLILEKDNPSGLPEHSQSFEIPINFNTDNL